MKIIWEGVLIELTAVRPTMPWMTHEPEPLGKKHEDPFWQILEETLDDLCGL